MQGWVGGSKLVVLGRTYFLDGPIGVISSLKKLCTVLMYKIEIFDRTLREE